jgi:lipoprotein signal peptidase
MLRRLLLYVGIALVCLAATGLILALSIRTGISVPGRWVGLILWTLLVFWVIVSRRREYWARLSFWLAAAGLLAGHLLAFMVILNNYPQWRPIWFAPVAVVEAGALGGILDALMHKHGVAR